MSMFDKYNKTATVSASPAATGTKMYTVKGANFQEWATNRVDFKGSVAHKAIGQLVTDINNNRCTVEYAEKYFISLLSN